MPAATQDADGRDEDLTVGRILVLLQEALEIADELDDRPEIGARLQGLIDSLENPFAE